MIGNLNEYGIEGHNLQNRNKYFAKSYLTYYCLKPIFTLTMHSCITKDNVVFGMRTQRS